METLDFAGRKPLDAVCALLYMDRQCFLNRMKYVKNYGTIKVSLKKVCGVT